MIDFCWDTSETGCICGNKCDPPKWITDAWEAEELRNRIRQARQEGADLALAYRNRIPDNHLRKPCPDGPSYRTTGSQVEQWVPGQGWVDITPGVVLADG